MKEREKKELMILLNRWDPECNQDCSNCEYGVTLTYDSSYMCPIHLVREMLDVKFYEPEVWERLHG